MGRGCGLCENETHRFTTVFVALPGPLGNGNVGVDTCAHVVVKGCSRVCDAKQEHGTRKVHLEDKW